MKYRIVVFKWNSKADSWWNGGFSLEDQINILTKPVAESSSTQTEVGGWLVDSMTCNENVLTCLFKKP